MRAHFPEHRVAIEPTFDLFMSVIPFFLVYKVNFFIVL